MENSEGQITRDQSQQCVSVKNPWGTETEVRAYVERIARKVRRSCTAELDLDDLIALGYTGILRAKQTFDSTKGYGWMQHAYWRTYGAMVDGARQWSHHSHSRTLFKRDQRRSVSLESNCSAFSRSRVGTEQGVQFSTSSVDMLQSPESVHGESGFVERDLVRKIGWMTTKLPMDQRVIIELHYHFEMTMTEIGDLFGHSKSWVSRKHSKAVSELQHLFDKASEPPVSPGSHNTYHSLSRRSSVCGMASVSMARSRLAGQPRSSANCLRETQ